MRQETGVSYLITYEEFAFLANWSGLARKLGEGFPLPGLDRERAVALAYSLVKKEILCSDGEKFLVCQPWKECLGRFAAAGRIWVFQDGKGKLPPVYVYPGASRASCPWGGEPSAGQVYEGELCMLAGASRTRKGILSVQFVDRGQLPVWLSEEGYLPEELYLTESDGEWLQTAAGECVCSVWVFQGGEEAGAEKGDPERADTEKLETVSPYLRVMECVQGYFLEDDGGERMVYTVEGLFRGLGLQRMEITDEVTG